MGEAAGARVGEGLPAAKADQARKLGGLHKLLYFNMLCGCGIRIADGVCGAGVVGTVARGFRHGAAASPQGKPPKATTRPYTRHILGIDSGVQSHTKATPRLHQSHPKATPRLHQGSTKATPKRRHRAAGGGQNRCVSDI